MFDEQPTYLFLRYDNYTKLYHDVPSMPYMQTSSLNPLTFDMCFHLT